MADSSRNLRDYTRAVDRTSQLAHRVLGELFERYGDRSADDLRDALLLGVPGVVERFGEISVEAALEYYERERSQVADSYYWQSHRVRVSVGEVERVVRYHAGKLYAGDTAGFRLAVEAEVDRWVKLAARRAIIATSESDKACTGWARVPTGAETCAFCFMLASRGFAYKTASSAGLERKFHTKCDCRVVPEFLGKTPSIKGYDPEKMYAVYKESHQKGDKASDVLYRMRRKHPDLFTDGVGGNGGGKPPKPPKASLPEPEEFRKFKSNAAGVRWAKENLRVITRENDPEKVIDYYTGSGYLDLNPALRDARGEIPEKFAERVRALDELISQSVIPENIILHRGTTGGEFEFRGQQLGEFLNQKDVKRLRGTVQQAWSYLSTSVGSESAFPTNQVQIHFEVPAGTKGINVMNLSVFGESEREILLERGLRYIINHTEIDEATGIAHIFARILE